MHKPPSDPRHRSALRAPSWGDVVAAYAFVAAVVALFWVVTYPLAAAVVLAVVAGGGGVRYAVRLVRCVRDCRAVVFDLGERVRISVTGIPNERSGVEAECC